MSRYDPPQPHRMGGRDVLVTNTGLVIGILAPTPKPALPRDAVTLQSALLTPETDPASHRAKPLHVRAWRFIYGKLL